jgi:hypothetical protein
MVFSCRWVIARVSMATPLIRAWNVATASKCRSAVASHALMAIPRPPEWNAATVWNITLPLTDAAVSGFMIWSKKNAVSNPQADSRVRQHSRQSRQDSVLLRLSFNP